MNGRGAASLGIVSGWLVIAVATAAFCEVPCAELRVIDEETGRGIPLAELETVNSVVFVTDNAGRIAICEPGLLNREIFFFVRSHGYEVPKDGFGIAGVRLTPRAGQVANVRLRRTNVAERLCRLTGEGLYRDSLLLGHDVPIADRLNRGKVAGQDSVQATIYRDKIYWFWGDTQRMNYPLGLFRVAGATTPLFHHRNIFTDPSAGIPFDYFVDDQGFARAMMPLPERPEGVVWISALCVVPDHQGSKHLMAHYSRRKGLDHEYEQGIARFNDTTGQFEVAKQLPLDETWRRPSGHPIIVEEAESKWIYFGSPTPNVRVRANLEALLEPTQYESFTCARAGPNGEMDPDIGPSGSPNWRWQKTLPPVGSLLESQWLQQGIIQPEQLRFCPANVDAPADRIVLHSGTVRWNTYRNCWVLVAGQIFGKSSMLGEVWYSEARDPTGPFSNAVRIVTHDRQSFYNVCHHSFLDQFDGKVIYFEGTYSNEFSGNPARTPRYNYNQIFYRLDLGAHQLRQCQAP